MSQKKQRNRKPKTDINKKLLGVLTIVFLLLVVIVFGKYYLEKTINRERLAGYLPADRTIAIMEFNLNPERSDAKALVEIAETNELISRSVSIVNSVIPNQASFFDWYAHRGGMAILSTPDEHDFRAVLFLAKNNTENAADWVQSLGFNGEGDVVFDNQFYGQKLISYQSGQKIQILWTEDFLIFSEEREPLEAIARTLKGENISIKTMPVYNQLSSALPEQNLGFLYLNRSELLKVLNKNQNFLSGRLALFKLYFPFLNIFSEEGATLRLEYNSENQPILRMNHITLFNQEKINQGYEKEIEYFYKGSLEKTLPDGISFYTGGSNLLDQKNRLQEYLKTSGGMNGIIYAGLINEVENTLNTPGREIDLENDLISALKENYLFYIRAENDSIPDWGAIITSDKPENDILKLKKAIEAIGPKFASQYLAKPVSITLPDGTTGTELKAEIGQPVIKQIQMLGQKMEQLSFSPEFSVFMWADHEEKLLLITTSQADMQEMLEKRSRPADTDSGDYGIDKPTEVYFLDVLQIMDNYPELEILSPVKYIQIARKLTPIGIVSSYQIGL